MDKLIRQIEQISFNAWPSRQTISYDDWVIRISDGITRRANSINPIFGTNYKIEEKIEFCEKLFIKNNLPIVYKLTKESYPKNLDKLLNSKGYYFEAETSVQIMNLEKKYETDKSTQIILNEKLDENWLLRSLKFNNYDLNKKEGFKQIMSNILMNSIFIDLKIDNKYIGCGLGVIEGDYIGLFDIVISSEYRGNGFSKKIVESILNLGIQNGCTKAYLQVMTNNPIAQNLYKKIGFNEVYKYWYRVKEY